MLISAMDNTNDNKNTNSNSSSESNSFSISHEQESGDVQTENESESHENEENQSNRPSNHAQKSFSGSDTFPEIDMTEIKFLKAIGKGSFGVVHRAIWAGKIVAVKKVETDTEVTAFQNEIKQLSRVKHENIIQMYGTGTSVHAKCIIMEFANDGSLYQFLHCPPHSKYNLSNALSWLLQCAKAIAYLHAIEPRPIIHRDLKPLNLLLTSGRRVLKICDFGTACVLRSVMTDNKGSTAWMAPEVIKGVIYNEKCDVYSWGMILWELLTRRIPFEELGQTYRILWKVVNEVRPPLIQGCPKPIERLMERCWSDEQSSRPSMQEVVDVIYPLYKIMSGGDNQLISYSSSSGESYTESCVSPVNGESSLDHTSRDVSEFTSSNNTLDLPENGKGQSMSSEGQSTPGNNNNNHQDILRVQRGTDDFSHPIQNPISPNVSASVVVKVENLLPPWGSAKSDDVLTPSAISPVPPRSPSGIRTSFVPPPEMLTPLSISIPNGGPAERNDVILATPGNHPMAAGIPTQPPNHPNCPYSPWIFPASCTPSPSRYSPQPPLAAVTSSPLIYPSPKVAVPPPQISTPPLTSVATTLTFTPPPASRDRNAPFEKAPMRVPMRHHLQSSDPVAVLRRRSAEVPHHHRATNVPTQGHRRSSSYESSELIGFEPLADELLKETQHACGGVRSPSETGQRKKDKFPHDFGHGGGNRISEEVVSPFKSDADEPPGTRVPPSSASSFFQIASYTPEVGASSGGVPSSIFAANSTAPSRGNVNPALSPSPTKTPSKGGASVSEGPTHPKSKGPAPPVSTESEELGAFWQFLDDDLKPAMPQPSCPQSQQIFNEHKGLAHQLLVVQEEIVYLGQEKNRLLMKLEEQDREQHACRQRYNDKIIQLKNKNESLVNDHSRLSQQLDEISSRRQKEQSKAPPDQHHHQQSPQNPPPPYLPYPQHPSQRQHLPQQYYYDTHHPQHPHHLYPNMHNP